MVGRFIPAALAAMLACGMVSTPALAVAQISQTAAIPTTNAGVVSPGGTSIISFNQFDSSLGTLLGVTLSFDAVSNTTVTISNNTPQVRQWSVTPGSSVSLVGNGFNLTDSFAGATSTLVIDPRISASSPRTMTLSSGADYGDTATLASGLAPFIGGGIVQFTFAALNEWVVTGSGGGFVFNPDAYTGSVKLDYSYQVPVNVVPEPATWALLIAGFAMVGATARRRRSVTLS